MDFYNFSERLEFILAGRKINPWAKRLNLSSGTASRLKQDIVPGQDVLTAIMRTENASLNWLLNASGKPFMVDIYLDAGDCYSQLKNHAKDCPQYRCDYLALDYLNMMCVVLSQPASYEFKGATIKYMQIEVLLSPFYSDGLKYTAPGYEHDFRILIEPLFKNSQEMRLDPLKIHYLVNGQLGTYAFFGDESRPGILNRS